MKQNKYSLSKKQITILSELMDADRKDKGVCYQDDNGEYINGIKEEIDFLRSFGFITEYTSEMHITDKGSINKKGWTITYHGVAFLFAYNTFLDHEQNKSNKEQVEIKKMVG